MLKLDGLQVEELLFDVLMVLRREIEPQKCLKSHCNTEKRKICQLLIQNFTQFQGLNATKLISQVFRNFAKLYFGYLLIHLRILCLKNTRENSNLSIKGKKIWGKSVEKNQYNRLICLKIIRYSNQMQLSPFENIHNSGAVGAKRVERLFFPILNTAPIQKNNR